MASITFRTVEAPVAVFRYTRVLEILGASGFQMREIVYMDIQRGLGEWRDLTLLAE